MCPAFRRQPIYLLLSCSASMKGEPLEALRMGLRALTTDLMGDPLALETAALSVISFAEEAEQLIPLVPLEKFVEPELQAWSAQERSLGKALALLKECMLQEINWSTTNRKGDYKPHVLLFIDGPATDVWQEQADSFKKSCYVNIIVCAMGPAIDETALRGLSDTFIRCQDISPGMLQNLLYAGFYDDGPLETSSVVDVNASPSNSYKKAILENGEHVEYIAEPIGEGGMKRVFFTADKRSVVCFYKDQVSTAWDPNRVARLEAIVGKYNPTTHPIFGKHFADLFRWPTGIIVQPEFGFIIPAYPDHFFFSSGNFKGKEKSGRWFSSPKLQKMLPPAEVGNWFGCLQMCKKMAQAIRKMHMTGLAHSDLSCNSVLLDPSTGTCMIIGIVDSLVVPGIHPPDVLGTPGYMAPEVLSTQRLPVGDPHRKLPSCSTNLFSLAVLIYELLLHRHPLKGPKVNSRESVEDKYLSMGSKALFIENPHDTSNHWSNSKDWPEMKPTCNKLGPYLERVIMQAFVDGLHNPTARPTAGDWETALSRSEDLLIPCGNTSCQAKWFIYMEGQTPTCPWCGWTLNNPIPILDFHYEDRNGHFRPEGHSLVCWDGRELYKWHVFFNIRHVEGVDTQVQARVQYYHGHWKLLNLNLDSMVSPTGNTVPKEDAIYLREGDEIVLSKANKGYHVSVRMIP